MIDSLFNTFYYLERHLGWKIKIGFLTKDNKYSSGIYYLERVVPNEYIEVSLDDNKYKFEFYGPNNYIKTIDISCQEGYYIRIYKRNNNIKKIDNFNNLYNSFVYLKNKNNKIYNDLFTKSEDVFSNKSKVYLFSNEPDLWNLINIDSLENKKILAITGSGDFFFNTCLLGSKEIDLIDINKYSYYYFEIKKDMIKKYNYEEFISKYIDIKNIYNSFKEYSNYLSQNLKEELISNFNIYSNDINGFMQNIFWSDSYLFNNKTNIDRRISFIKTSNYYLHDENSYNNLRKLLLEESVNYNISISSIFDLNFNNNYDYVYLSNIGDYYDYDSFVDLLVRIGKSTNEKIILVYRTDNYHQLLNNNNFEIEIINNNTKTSLNNIILVCSYNTNKKTYNL